MTPFGSTDMSLARAVKRERDKERDREKDTHAHTTPFVGLP